VQLFSQGEKGILKGFVIDIKTDEKLSSANILIIGTNRGVVTDLRGFFELELDVGRYFVEARFVGYETERKEVFIESNEETEIFFELKEIPIGMDSVVVTGRKTEYPSKSYELYPGELRNIPQFGEPDVFRALFALPGVSSVNDVSNQLYIQGGNFDEVLISLDDAPIYNPYHLGGIFSSVNSDIIQKEELFFSNYPISMGGYLSGALNLHTKTGNNERLKPSATLGLVSSRGYFEGPIDDATFIVSARRTYLDFIGDILKEDFPYYFYDFYGKCSLPLDANNHLSFSTLYTKDV